MQMISIFRNKKLELIDVFAWIVRGTIIFCLIGLLAFLGLWPGRVAGQRQHPYVEAITLGSWVALLAGGLLWPLVLIWAYATPAQDNEPGMVPGDEK
jgi:prepilin signal peptidase PulO-like enzyme (type II secretory pathway)